MAWQEWQVMAKTALDLLPKKLMRTALAVLRSRVIGKTTRTARTNFPEKNGNVAVQSLLGNIWQ
jgi:hypothetical protein